MNRVAPIVGLASHLGRGVQRIVTDTVVGHLRSLPRTVGDLDAGTLTRIIGRTVTSVSVMGGLQAEGIAREGLRRGVAALEDLDTVALLTNSL